MGLGITVGTAVGTLGFDGEDVGAVPAGVCVGCCGTGVGVGLLAPGNPGNFITIGVCVGVWGACPFPGVVGWGVELFPGFELMTGGSQAFSRSWLI